LHKIVAIIKFLKSYNNTGNEMMVWVTNILF